MRSNDYEIKLVIEYKNAAGRTEIIESDALVYEKTNTEPAPTPKPSTGCAMASAELFISLISLTAVLGLAFRKRH
jgi:hypothetical protein